MKMIPKKVVSGPARVRGFTLIELMIVAAVIAVLAAIAYANYQDMVVKSRRASAAACLSEVAQFMERYNTTNQTYVGAAVPTLTCRTDLAAFYDFAIVGAPNATQFSISATPIDHQLAQDGTKCGTLGLNQAGQRSVTGTSGVPSCW